MNTFWPQMKQKNSDGYMHEWWK